MGLAKRWIYKGMELSWSRTFTNRANTSSHFSSHASLVSRLVYFRFTNNLFAVPRSSKSVPYHTPTSPREKPKRKLVLASKAGRLEVLPSKTRVDDDWVRKAR